MRKYRIITDGTYFYIQSHRRNPYTFFLTKYWSTLQRDGFLEAFFWPPQGGKEYWVKFTSKEQAEEQIKIWGEWEKYKNAPTTVVE